MKASELRIGNLVNHGEAYRNKYENPNVIGWMDLEDTADFDPIPLTEEWLFKLGFLKYKGNNKDFWLNDFEFANDLKWIFWKGNVLENVKYVHQLQNLYFALTGEELIFKKIGL